MYGQHEAGWWWPFENAVIFTERSKTVLFDQNKKLHCEDGPAIEYRDERIRNELNAELARCMIEIVGPGKFLKDSGAEKIHEDEWGKLWRANIDQDEPYVAVEVINSTAEPDGSFKTYFLQVHPELRPIPDTEEGEWNYGEPQALTALNAVASTFGMRGEEYRPYIET